MPLTRQQKEAVVERVKEILDANDSVIFANFRGIDVAETNAMRQEFKNRGVGYTVVKKTLARRALEEAGISGEQPPLEGELAIAYGADAVMPAKTVAEFQKKYEDRLAPMGGVLESHYLSREEVEQLAAIPSREVLYGQLVGMLNAPIQQTVGVLNNVTSSFVVALDQIAQQKS